MYVNHKPHTLALPSVIIRPTSSVCTDQVQRQGIVVPVSIKISLLMGCLLEPRLCCEITSRDMFWSYIIKANLFIVLLIEYVSSIRSSM